MSGIFQVPGGKDLSPSCRGPALPQKPRVTPRPCMTRCAQRVRLLALGPRRYPRVGDRAPGRSGGRHRRAPAGWSVPSPPTTRAWPASSALDRRPGTGLTATSSWCRPSASRRSDSFSFGCRPTRLQPGSASASTSAAISSAARSLPSRQRSRPHDASRGDIPRVRSCPIRARSRGQTRVLTVTHETSAIAMTCISAGLTGHSRSLPSWSCGFDYRRPLLFTQVKDGF